VHKKKGQHQWEKKRPPDHERMSRVGFKLGAGCRAEKSGQRGAMGTEKDVWGGSCKESKLNVAEGAGGGGGEEWTCDKRKVRRQSQKQPPLPEIPNQKKEGAPSREFSTTRLRGKKRHLENYKNAAQRGTRTLSRNQRPIEKGKQEGSYSHGVLCTSTYIYKIQIDVG